jgi:hypothetical protein
MKISELIIGLMIFPMILSLYMSSISSPYIVASQSLRNGSVTNHSLNHFVSPTDMLVNSSPLTTNAFSNFVNKTKDAIKEANKPSSEQDIISLNTFNAIQKLAIAFVTFCFDFFFGLIIDGAGTTANVFFSIAMVLGGYASVPGQYGFNDPIVFNFFVKLAEIMQMVVTVVIIIFMVKFATGRDDRL